MLFTREEKNILMGAFTSGLVDTALESYYNYKAGAGYDIKQHPEDPLYWLYYDFGNPWIPPTDDLVALIALPVGLWYAGKMRKSAKLREMGIGAMVYGFSEVLGWFALKVGRMAAGQPIYKVAQQRVGVKA